MRKFNVGDYVSWLENEYKVVRTDFMGEMPYVVLGEKEFYVYEKDVIAVDNSADFVEDLV